MPQGASSQASPGKPRESFRYRDYGTLATIGRRAAVVEMHGLQLSGTFAWCFWLAAHIFFLIGFRNRLVVLIDWAWAYFTYDRGARIIVSQARRNGGGTSVPSRTWARSIGTIACDCM